MYRAALAPDGLPSDQAKLMTDMQTAYRDATAEEDSGAVSLDDALNATLVYAALVTRSHEFHTPAQAFVWDWICSTNTYRTTLGRAIRPEALYLGDTVLAAALAQIYIVQLLPPEQMGGRYKRGFQCFAQQQACYLIGTNWNRKSYVVSLGKKGYDRTIHRGASCPPADPDNLKPCPPDARASSRPDINEITGSVLWLPEATDDPKNTRGGNNTSVSLTDNATLPLLMAGLQQSTVSWGLDFGMDESDDDVDEVAAGAAVLPFTRDPGRACGLVSSAAWAMYALMESMPDTRYSDNNPQFAYTYASDVPRAHEFLAAAWMFRMAGPGNFSLWLRLRRCTSLLLIYILAPSLAGATPSRRPAWCRRRQATAACCRV
eukprot:jgi/Ulvmu1/11719/UM008_0130.1